MLSLDLYLLSIAIAVVAFVYSEVLVDHGMILFVYKDFLFTKLSKRFEWIYKILVGCVYCVSGQWALWIYLFLVFVGTETFDLNYDLFEHITFISFTIFNVVLIKKAGIYGEN